MHRTLLRLTPAALALLACRADPPSRADDVANAQAELAADTAQARLWRQAAAAETAREIGELHVDSGAVRPGAPARVPERGPGQRPTPPFDQSVDAALALVEAPPVDPPFAGTARVTAVDGELLSLDLGGGRTLRLHVKVAGGPLRAGQGDQARLLFGHADDPFVANDRLALQLPQDDLLYALVGGSGLVSLALPPFRLTAQQTDPVEANTAPVRVTVGGETRLLQAGETAAFESGNLTVRVLASVAVQGEAANALPGEPYRLQLLGWRTRPSR